MDMASTESKGAVISDDESWVKFSDMDKTAYTSWLTGFSIASSLLTHPFNVLMTRQQAGSAVTGDLGLHSNSNSMIKAFRSAVGTIGMRGLLRGWMPITVMGVPSQVIYFSVTESSREYLQGNMRRFLPGLSDPVIDGMQSLLSSVIANVTSLVPYVPAEVISSRLIVQQGRNNIGIISMTKLIILESGYRGLYKGFTTSCLVSIAFSSQWWWSYSVSRRAFSKIERFSNNPLLLDASAGLLAGLISTTICHPLDTIRTRIQTGGSSQVHILPALREIVKKDGRGAVWKGISASLYQSALSSMGFAIAYELIKRFSIIQKEEEKTT